MSTRAEYLDAVSSPAGYGLVRLGLDLYPWQVEVLDSLEGVGSRVSLRTCNESGKTSVVIASLLMWHMETFPGSLGITTSGVYRQITQQLYPPCRAISSRLGDHIRVRSDTMDCSTTGSRVVSFSTDDAGNAEGYHSLLLPAASAGVEEWARAVGRGCGLTEDEMGEILAGSRRSSLLIVVDEAKTVPDEIFHAFERCHATRVLVASSPGRPVGYFYETQSEKQGHRWKRFHVQAKDCDHLWHDAAKRAELEDQIKTFGSEHPLVKSMVFGEFADVVGLSVFRAEDVSYSMCGMVPTWGVGDRRASLDLSGGGDSAPLYQRNGNVVSFVREWHERDHKRLVREVIRELVRLHLRPEQVSADCGGLGGPILTEFADQGWRLSPVDFGGKARNPKAYTNRRAEMYLTLSQRLRRHEVVLPDVARLRDELLFQELVDKDGPLQLVEKRLLPHSPDHADAVVMLCDDMADPRELYGIDWKGEAQYPDSRTPKTGPNPPGLTGELADQELSRSIFWS